MERPPMSKRTEGQGWTGGGGSEQEVRKRQVLLRNAAFAALSVEAMAEVVRKSTLVRFARRRALYEADEPGQAIFVVASGRTRVVRYGGVNRVVTLAYRGPGELLGESCVAGADTHEDSALAQDTVEAVMIPARLVARLLDAHTGFCRRLLAVMGERRREIEVRLQALLTRSVESRLAEFLLDAATHYGIPESRGVLVGVKFTHQEVASYIGATRETVTVTLGDLKRRELLLVDHRRLVLTDVDALRALVR